VRRLFAALLALVATAAGLDWSTAPAATQRSVSISWVGDIAMGASSDGGAGFFSSAIRQRLRSDVAIGSARTAATRSRSRT
jgi:hypothetical protein